MYTIHSEQSVCWWPLVTFEFHKVMYQHVKVWWKAWWELLYGILILFPVVKDYLKDLTKFSPKFSSKFEGCSFI